MAAAVTLQQLRDLARLYADERPDSMTGFLPDTEMNLLINRALAGLYDKLVAARGHEFYVTEATIALVNGQASYNLPADFYELLNFYIGWSASDIEPVEACELREIPLLKTQTWGKWSRKAFRVQQTKLNLFPTPTGTGTCALIYVPAFQPLTSDTATFDSVNGWDRAVALEVAAEVLMLQEKSNTAVLQRRDEEMARIEALAAQRAALHPRRILDVQPEGYMRRFPERLPRP